MSPPVLHPMESRLEFYTGTTLALRVTGSRHAGIEPPLVTLAMNGSSLFCPVKSQRDNLRVS